MQGRCWRGIGTWIQEEIGREYARRGLIPFEFRALLAVIMRTAITDRGNTTRLSITICAELVCD